MPPGTGHSPPGPGRGGGGGALLLCRHGERRDFAEGGWNDGAERPFDPPLSKHGLEQSRRLGLELKKRGHRVDAVFASRFLRSVQTGGIVAQLLDAPVYVEDGLLDALDAVWYRTWSGEHIRRCLGLRLSPETTPLHGLAAEAGHPLHDKDAAGLLRPVEYLQANVCRRIDSGYKPVVDAARWGISAERPETLEHARERTVATVRALAAHAQREGRSYLLVGHLNTLQYLANALDPEVEPVDHRFTALSVFAPGTGGMGWKALALAADGHVQLHVHNEFW